jgi:hypothetical protein
MVCGTACGEPGVLTRWLALSSVRAVAAPLGSVQRYYPVSILTLALLTLLGNQFSTRVSQRKHPTSCSKDPVESARCRCRACGYSQARSAAGRRQSGSGVRQSRCAQSTHPFRHTAHASDLPAEVRTCPRRCLLGSQIKAGCCRAP